MRPALLVDIDCDIYEGTLEGLEFLFKGGLLLPGYSTVYYDDWQSEAHGEAKAHHQLARKHGAVWRNLQLSAACLASGRSCGRQRLFQLVSRSTVQHEAANLQSSIFYSHTSSSSSSSNYTTTSRP